MIGLISSEIEASSYPIPGSSIITSLINASFSSDPSVGKFSPGLSITIEVT
jgi:hypothetical protein